MTRFLHNTCQKISNFFYKVNKNFQDFKLKNNKEQIKKNIQEHTNNEVSNKVCSEENKVINEAINEAINAIDDINDDEWVNINNLK
jgi:hypothetical protein